MEGLHISVLTLEDCVRERVELLAMYLPAPLEFYEWVADPGDVNSFQSTFGAHYIDAWANYNYLLGAAEAYDLTILQLLEMYDI